MEERRQAHAGGHSGRARPAEPGAADCAGIGGSVGAGLAAEPFSLTQAVPASRRAVAAVALLSWRAKAVIRRRAGASHRRAGRALQAKATLVGQHDAPRID